MNEPIRVRALTGGYVQISRGDEQLCNLPYTDALKLFGDLPAALNAVRPMWEDRFRQKRAELVGYVNAAKTVLAQFDEEHPGLVAP